VSSSSRYGISRPFFVDVSKLEDQYITLPRNVEIRLPNYSVLSQKNGVPKPEVHYRIRKNMPLDPITSHMIPVYTLQCFHEVSIYTTPIQNEFTKSVRVVTANMRKRHAIIEEKKYLTIPRKYCVSTCIMFAICIDTDFLR
jgi:hypothetical protein